MSMEAAKIRDDIHYGISVIDAFESCDTNVLRQEGEVHNALKIDMVLLLVDEILTSIGAN